ncbi:hypothetical protein ACJJTC_018842 [Scirpophaga incertulas]
MFLKKVSEPRPPHESVSKKARTETEVGMESDFRSPLIKDKKKIDNKEITGPDQYSGYYTHNSVSQQPIPTQDQHYPGYSTQYNSSNQQATTSVPSTSSQTSNPIPASPSASSNRSIHSQDSDYLWIGEGLCGEGEYVARIYQEAVSFLRSEWKKPAELPTLREWVSTGVWMRGKAGTGATVAIRIEGKVKRTRRYKGVDAVLYSDRQIENEILGLAHEEMVVLQKSEGGKVRPVLKTGNRINRKMDFLSEVVEKGLYGSRVSTLFAGAQGNEDIDIMWARQVRNPDSLKVPLDQGGFDQHQSLPTIRAVLTAIGDVCISATRPGSEYRRVWEVLWHSLIGRRVEIRLGGESFTWGNGIPSGWRWTALLDTLLNYCSLKAIQGVTQIRVGRGIPLGNITVQGDDVMMTAKNLEDAAEIIAGYGDAGYEVHPSKTFFSRERGEFLRRSYEPGIITGYITRTQLAIRFRNPVLEMPVSKEERAASRAPCGSFSETWGRMQVELRGGATTKGDAVAKQSAKVAPTEGTVANSAPTLKPAPGGAGTDPAPKLGTTPEAAEKNADHRKAEDVA